MHYAKLIRSVRYNVTLNEPEKQTPSVSEAEASEMVKLLRELSEKTATEIPERLKEENTILNDYEVNELLECALHFQDKYFQHIPLKKDLIKPFVWNIPRSVLDGVRYCRNHTEEAVPDLLNPMLLMYLFLTENPADAIGAFMSTLIELIDLDGNREAIEDDALAYLADQNAPDEDEEEETNVE